MESNVSFDGVTVWTDYSRMSLAVKDHILVLDVAPHEATTTLTHSLPITAIIDDEPHAGWLSLSINLVRHT